MRRFMLTFFVAVFCAVGSDAAASSQSDWERFRTDYPYHIQAIAVGSEDRGGRTLIIAEPPPATTLAALQQGWPREFRDAVIRKHSIGVDGWVADIVTRIPPQSDESTQALVEQLTRYLFGTSYKSYALSIGEPVPAASENLDVAVSTGQLSSWFGLRRSKPGARSQGVSAVLWMAAAISILAVLRTRRLKWVIRAALCAGALFFKGYLEQPPPPDVRFVERHTIGQPQTLEAVLNAGGGVYDSERRGLVLFVLPRSASLDSYPVALREFVLDTDVILGAVGTDRTTAIIGRERVVPVSLMPPLRVETLLQLASVKSAELAQSYERRNLFAGRFDSKRNRDWAPIYLSAELKDTEYGSVLNITDQLLKSLSQHGDVRYANFDYPEPPKYPFPVRLSTHAKASTVTFNWNTKGVGYSDTITGLTLLAFARTGSLPVDYLGERDSRLRDAEDIAYEYFATSTDPNLARVVQYAGAYQIFRAFDIGATNPYVVPPASLDRTRLERLASRALEHLRSIDVERTVRGVPPSPEGREVAEQFGAVVTALEEFHAAYKERGNVDLSAALIEPRAWAMRAERSRSEYDLAVLELTYGIMNNPLVTAMFGDEVRKFALDTYLDGPPRPDKNWIRTPSVVVSWTTGADAANVTGGHSLSSRITRYAVDDSLAAGDVRVIEMDGSRTIFYSGRDEARIHATVRRAGRAEQHSPDDLRNALRQQLQTVQPRLGPVSEILKTGEAQIADRGLGAHAGVPVSPATWSHRSGLHPAHAAKLKMLERPDTLGIVIERQQDGILMSVQGQRSSIFAPDTPSAVDAFVARTRPGGGGSPPRVDVTFANFEPEQARGFIRSAELHTPQGRRGRVNAMVEVDGNVAAVARARRTEWNVGAAKVETRRVNVAGDVEHSLEIPATRRGASPLRLVVEATEGATSKIRALLTDFLSTIGSLRSIDDLFAALHDLVAQLMAVPGVKTVRPIQIQEAGDTYLVRHAETGSAHAAD